MNNSSSQLSFPAVYVIAEKKTDKYFTAIVKFLKQNRDVRT